MVYMFHDCMMLVWCACNAMHTQTRTYSYVGDELYINVGLHWVLARLLSNIQMVLSHRMSSCRNMAEQPKLHSSPTAFLYPLATVATAQTIGGGLTPLIQSLMSPSCEFRCPSHNSLAPAINKIHAINSDHCYPKINTFVPILSNCVPLLTRTLFDKLKDVQTAYASGGLITLHRSDPQTAEQEEKKKTLMRRWMKKQPYHVQCWYVKSTSMVKLISKALTPNFHVSHWLNVHLWQNRIIVCMVAYYIRSSFL